MNGHGDFALTDLPHVCLRCGGGGPLAAQPVKYTRTSGGPLTALAFLVGVIYYQELTYRLQLPLCAACSGGRRRKRLALLLTCLAVGVLFFPATEYGLDYPVLFALPVVVAVVGFVYAAVMQARSTPRAVRVSEDLLVIDVPGHGHLTLYERGAAPPAATRREDAGPRLNRTVCGGCGFINFAHAVECKKCRAPLGEAAAV
jgi:hypothetical protein